MIFIFYLYSVFCSYSWCGPCKLLIPRLETLGAVKDGKAILAKIDIDELPDLAGNYGVCADLHVFDHCSWISCYSKCSTHFLSRPLEEMLISVYLLHVLLLTKGLHIIHKN